MASCRMLAASPAPSDRPCVFTLAPYKPKSQTSSEFYYFGSGGGAGSWNSNSNVDSGLSSDQEGQTPPPLPRRRAGRSGSRNEDCDWSDRQSDVSADSLANDDAATESTSLSSTGSAALDSPKSKAIPAGLLDEIRLKGSAKKRSVALDAVQHNLVNMRLSTPRARSTQRQPKAPAESSFPTLRSRRDSYPASGSARSLDDLLGFHLRECGEQHKSTDDDLSFVGHKDLLSDDQKNVTIRSHKGTVRGVRNRVRAGINTFLQGKPFKNYGERERGKVVVYTTSMGVVRTTYQRCLQVQRILGTLLINYEERDVSMNRQVQNELKERTKSNRVSVPQVFVEGQFLGDADAIEKLNESGDLRKILRRFKRVGPETICDNCGGYRYLPCSVCNGSKKSIHRNHFTTEFVALKCMNCDEAGLVRCSACNAN